jgi:tetratricopeptide (TPR) repeat protein
MNPNKDNYYKIEAYLCDGLPPAEKSALEKAIERDPKLKKQVEMQRLEWDGMEFLVEDDLRHKMKDWDSEMPFELATDTPDAKIVALRPIYIYRYHAAIAASLLLAIGSWWLWQTKKVPVEQPVARVEQPKPIEVPTVEPSKPIVPPATAQVTPKKPIVTPAPTTKTPVRPKVQPSAPVVEVPSPVAPEMPQTPPTVTEDYTATATLAYQEVTPPFTTSRTRSNEPDNPLTTAQKAYEQQDFKQVIALLNGTPLQEVHFEALSLLAHAYFQQKNFAAALPIFEQLVEWSSRTTRLQAEWYLLLNYLAQYGQYKTQFKALAQKISQNPNHLYQKQAAKLLESIPN